MKKIILLVIATIFSFAIVEANETANATTNSTNTEISAEAPSYWSGWATDGGTWTRRLYITVYRSANMCDSFYAVASKLERKANNYTRPNYTEEINEELIVKERSIGDYYVTYRGLNYYFKM